MAPQSILRLKAVYRPRTPWMKEQMGSFEEGHSQKFMLLILLQVFFKETWPFTRMTVYWRIGNNETFWTRGYWLWTDANSRRSRISLWSTSQSAGTYGSHVISRVLVQVYVTVGSMRPWSHPVAIFASSRIHKRKRHTQQLAESPHWFSDCGVRVITVGKARWTSLELPLPRKVANWNCISRGMAEINAIIRERCRSGDSHIFIQLAHLACAEDRRTFENDSGSLYN